MPSTKVFGGFLFFGALAFGQFETSEVLGTVRDASQKPTANEEVVGGPIIKDRLFFFGDYKGYRQKQGYLNTYSVSSLNDRPRQIQFALKLLF